MSLLSEFIEQWRIPPDPSQRPAMLSALLEDHRDELVQIYINDPLEFTRLEIAATEFRMGGLVKKIVATIKRMARAAQDQEEARTKISPDNLTDLGFPDLMSPGGYEVKITGVWDGDDMVTPEPILISGWSEDIETGEQRWELAWRHQGAWVRKSVARDAAGDPKRLQKLSAYGLPVDMESAKGVVRYLSSFYAENHAIIPQHVTTPRMGWLNSTCRAFQYGEDSIGNIDSKLSAEGGLVDVAAGYRVAGEWEDWRASIAKHLPGRHTVQLGIYAAAVAPLLEILQIDGFVVDWSGATSRGKTSLLRVAASVWGDPKSVVGTWRTASTAGPLSTAAFLCNLPLVLDDTKHAKNDQIVASMMYAISGGKDTTRAQVDGGLRTTKTWRTVMLSTGEKAILDFSEDAGARGRTLCLRGAPFGGGSDANRIATEELTTMTYRNHGHIGKRLLSHLSGPADHEALRALHKSKRDAHAAQADGSVSARLAAPVAALELVAELLHDLGLPGREQMGDALELAWESALESGENSDRPIEAARSLYSWASANSYRFIRSPKITSDPVGGWAGFWMDGRLGVVSQDARRLLEIWGFDVGYCINEWKRRGWLECNKGRRTKKFRTPTGGILTTICLDLGAVPGINDD